jgi:hypothetical protein
LHTRYFRDKYRVQEVETDREAHTMLGAARIPGRLKRLLVPIWNESHRLGWICFDYANALAHARFERCIVCGRFRFMLYRRRVIPPRLQELWGLSEQLASALARKESCACAHCGAKLRGRRLAQIVLRAYPVQTPPVPRSLAEWVRHPETRSLRVAEINRIDGLHQELALLPQFTGSDYEPGSPPGTAVAGVRSEDLRRLTFASSSVDLLLTSETLEHVPGLEAALSEIHRVLAPGGRHIFTVPLMPGVAQTFARAIEREDGSIEQKAVSICHPGGDTGYPVFTEFGADLPELLQQAGFEVEIFFGPPSEQDLAQVFVCTKPGA